MAQPSTREEFRKYGLRQLGEPVIQVNVAKVQQEDLIDDALQMFHEHAFEGVTRDVLAYQVTQADIDNNYVTIPADVLSVHRVFDMNAGNSSNPLNSPINYTIADYKYALASVYGGFYRFDIQNYVISQQYASMASDLVNGEREYEFNYTEGRVKFFAPLENLVNEGEYLMFDCYRTVDPNTFPRVWNNIFLKRYYVAILKKQFGENLKKFGDMQLPGGTTLNGKEIFDEAVEELNQLEEDVYTKYSEPPHFFTG